MTSTYQRPGRARRLSTQAWPGNTACDSKICSEQVHLVLGGPGEMKVMFASRNWTTPSSVEWWGTDGIVRTATGSADTYALLLFLETDLIDVGDDWTMGKQPVDEETWIKLSNTSGWASRSPFYPYEVPEIGEKDDRLNLQKGDKLESGFMEYGSEDSFYTSPAIHSVTLSGLQPGGTYCTATASRATGATSPSRCHPLRARRPTPSRWA